MRFQNNPILGEMLVRGGRADLARIPEFELDDLELAERKVEVHRQRLHDDPEELEARAVYRLLTKPQPAAVPLPSRFARLRAFAAQATRIAWPWLKVAWALAVLGLLIALAAKAEPHNVAQDDALIHTALRSPVFAQVGGLIVQFQNQGSTIGTFPAFLRINCSTNMACSASGTTITMSASSTGSTAWSAITASANSNAGTFSASGNSWDWTATTIFKLRAGAGATTSANGDIAFDTTAGRWHLWLGADDFLIAASNVGTSGQVCLSNANGSCTFADPQVTGNVASGAADSGNPVKTGYVFNSTQPTVTTGQRVDAQGTARGAAIVATGVDTFHVTVDSAPTTAVTQSGTWNVGLNAGSNTIGAISNTAFSANQGTAAALSGKWPVQVTDGTNTMPTGDAAARTIHVTADNASIPVTESGTWTNRVVGNAGAAFDQAPGSAAPANAVQVGYTDGTNTRVPYLDPCLQAGRSHANINLTASGQVITGSNYTFICDLDIITGAAQNIALVEGTGTTCATGIAGMAGGTTAATGWNLAANGGLVKGNGQAWVYKTATSGDNVCLLLSGTGQTSGGIDYVQLTRSN